MAKKNKCPECPKGAPAWMTTFSDMTTLLLTFFILLISMSSLEIKKWMTGMESIKRELGVSIVPSMSKVDAVQSIKQGAQKKISNVRLMRALRELKKAIKEKGYSKDIDVKIVDGGIAIRISSPLMFSSGSAELRKEFYDILYKIVGVISTVKDYHVRVEGHTDNVPIRNNPRYKDNWELSAARAISVVRFLVKNGISPYRLSAEGKGEYYPIASNNTPEGRKKNRRVEIFIEFKDKKDRKTFLNNLEGTK